MNLQIGMGLMALASGLGIVFLLVMHEMLRTFHVPHRMGLWTSAASLFFSAFILLTNNINITPFVLMLLYPFIAGNFLTLVSILKRKHDARQFEKQFRDVIAKLVYKRKK